MREPIALERQGPVLGASTGGRSPLRADSAKAIAESKSACDMHRAIAKTKTRPVVIAIPPEGENPTNSGLCAGTSGLSSLAHPTTGRHHVSMISSDAGGDNHLNADEHCAMVMDDLAWAESITLRLADSYLPEGTNSAAPQSIIQRHRAA
jgi:hypothetical protein